jgi:hypothetical protein
VYTLLENGAIVALNAHEAPASLASHLLLFLALASNLALRPRSQVGDRSELLTFRDRIGTVNDQLLSPASSPPTAAFRTVVGFEYES